MNKNDLIAQVSDSTGVSRSDTTRLIEATLDAITAALEPQQLMMVFGSVAFALILITAVAERATDRL